MKSENSSNQAPIFKFLSKHKWRIVLPVLFALFYFALPRYFANYTAVQQNLFIKSSKVNRNETEKDIANIINQTQSDDFLQQLISKYDLYKIERKNNVEEKLLIEKLRKAIDIQSDNENLADSLPVFIWIRFKDENAQNIVAISNEITAQFENNLNLQVNKYVTEPYNSHVYRNRVFIGDVVVRGLLLFSIPLILLWEIPFLFYSPKTKEMVFEPLKSDWQNELLEAKLRNQTWKAIQINVRYTYAFLAAMWQKSPFGDLIEFVSKFAK